MLIARRWGAINTSVTETFNDMFELYLKNVYRRNLPTLLP